MNRSEWIVTAITTDDLAAILNIERQSPSPWTEGQLEGELFMGTEGLQLVCRDPESNRLIGFIMARTIAGEAEILKLAVESGYKRRQVASSLLSEALGRFGERGVKKCYLEMRAANIPARSLYENFHFVMTGLRKSYYTDPKDDALCMTLSLSDKE